LATNTPNLNLLKKDPVTDGNETFNIQTMLNDNWDKIDTAVGEIDIPDASLTVKGKVQLSNETDSDAEDRAATPKAVSGVALQAKSYTDQQIGLVTETGIPKLVSYPLLVTATTDNQTEFEIPLDLFDANADTLLVSINRATLDSTRYIVTNTVRDGSGQVMQRAKITLLTGIIAGSKISMVVLKNVPIGPEGAINGAVLAVDSVPINRVNGLQEKLDAQLADLSAQTAGKGASLVGIQDAAGLFTSMNAEGALREAMEKANSAFQSASDGKSAVAAAITGKGVQASGSDTFVQLAAKIGQIVLGRRIESGSGTGSNLGMTLTRYVNPTTTSIYSGYYSLTVSGLAFTPSLVIIRSQNISQATCYITLYMNGANFATLPGADIASLYLNINASSITPGAANLLKVDHDAYVINGGFRLPCSLGGNHAVYWTAIE
jgi:hypothetical protein